MKVLQLNTFDNLGGAARAAARLQQGLHAQGVDVSTLVQFKFGQSADVICNANHMDKVLRRLKTYLGTLPVRVYPNRPENNFSPALLPDNALAEVARIDPDIIHLHWLCAGFLQIETLRKLSELGKPLVWTLHDSWAFTGGCHVPFDCTRYREQCGSCPVLGSTSENDLSRRVWLRKAKALRDLNLNIVTPSHWLADCAQSSSLFHTTKVEVIPNGLSVDIFSPQDKIASRKMLGLSLDKKIILFGAVMGLSDPNKGFELLVGALREVAGRMEAAQAVVFGTSPPPDMPDLDMPVTFLGRIDDDRTLARLYSAANVFVAPSLMENLPNTVMEAMACGTPVVAFGSTGLLDIVEHKTSGYLAQPYKVEDLACGIHWVLSDSERHISLSEEARARTIECFDIKKISEKYIEFYQEVSEIYGIILR